METQYTEAQNKSIAKIMIVGVGGGGGNAVESMMKAGIHDVQFVAMNTDQQALNKLTCKRVPLGAKLTKGLGAGANPEIGKQSAEESRELIQKLFEDVDLLFIAAGMGGGTGTGAAPIIANIAKQLDILTIAVVTKPFNFEGVQRMRNANKGIEELKSNVDALVIVQNEKLNRDRNFSLMDAFVKADEILLQGVRGITDIIVQSGKINLDLADVRCVMKDCGMAHMGIGDGKGKNKTIDAIRKAVYSPLLETTIQGASAVIINFRSGYDLALSEVSQSVDLLRQVLSPDANVLYGMCYEEKMKDEVHVTLIATGFKGVKNEDTSAFFGAVAPYANIRNDENNDVVLNAPDAVSMGIKKDIIRNVTGDARPAQAHRTEIDGNLKMDEDPSIPPYLRKMKG